MLGKPKYHHSFIGKEKVGFSKSYHLEWDPDLGDDAAQIVLNIDVRSSAVPGEEVADEIFDALKNNFFQDLEKDPYTRFEQSLKMMNDIVKEKESQYGMKFLPNINVIVAIITGGTLYLSQHGDAEAYLVRKRHVSILSEGLHDSSTMGKEMFANVASGGMCPARANLLSLEVSDKISVSVVEMVAVEESGTVAEIPDEVSKRVVTEGLYSKFSRTFADNKVLNFISGKISDLREILNKLMQKNSVLSEWKRLGRDKVLISLVLVVLVLIVGIYLVRNQGQKQKYIEDLEAKLEQVSTKINEAQTKGSYDKDAAAELLDEAETVAMEVLASGYLRGSASEYLNAVQEQRDYLDNVIRVADATLLADLSEKRSTVSALGIVPYNDSLYVYEYNGLYEIVLGEVKDPLTIDDEEVVISGAYFEDQDTILFYTQDGDIIEYNGTDFNFMDTSDGDFQLGVDTDPYSSKLYILDSAGEQIWKYYRERDSYGGAEAYVLSEDVDLSKAVSMAIDGSIWVLNSDGTILKLVSGSPEEYNLERAPLSGFEGADKIYTAFESNQVYVLDPANNSVLVFNKDSKDGDLVYSTKYVFEGLDNLRDIYVAQNENRMYLVTDTQVWYYSY
ncbi:MAG: hypothetical protein UW03_C0005G0027 [Candidatus Peregrinibacteria bacterium GW2011_GWA2_43_8]|nr:MAG: hypothetical protein UW03_C0005G0027 [Candidatus Peregrinibacteria bacterium GW2011_GWA2_43_8]